jgi:hypothetical protein
VSRTTILFFTIALASGPLLAQKVGYNFDQRADFSRYHTYRWVDVGQHSELDSLTQQQIRSAVDDELAAKGLRRVEDDSSDLAIGFQTSLSQEKELSTVSSGWGYGPGWGSSWYGYGAAGMASSTTTSSTITVGTLALDMYDTSTKNLVWRGIATKTVDTTPDPAKRTKRLQKGAEKLLKDYPPKS